MFRECNKDIQLMTISNKKKKAKKINDDNER